MTIALSQLAYFKEHNPTAIDRIAAALKHVISEEVAILSMARLNQSLAYMTGFSGSSPEDLDKFRTMKSARCRKMIEDCAQTAPSTPLARTDFDIVPSLIPTAFATHGKADDSYAIGLDDGLIDIFAVLTLAALQAFRSRDVGIYKHFCLHVFGLYYGAPHPSIIRDFKDLAASYVDSAAGIKLMIDDIGETCVWFVLAHEAAHLALSHFRSAKAEHLSFDPQESDTEVSAFDEYACEFIADGWAVAHLDQQTLSDKRRQFAALQVPPMVMTFIESLTELSKGMTILGDTMIARHPPASERRERLRQRASTLNADRGVELDLILQIGDFIANH